MERWTQLRQGRKMKGQLKGRKPQEQHDVEVTFIDGLIKSWSLNIM